MYTMQKYVQVSYSATKSVTWALLAFSYFSARVPRSWVPRDLMELGPASCAGSLMDPCQKRTFATAKAKISETFKPGSQYVSDSHRALNFFRERGPFSGACTRQTRAAPSPWTPQASARSATAWGLWQRGIRILQRRRGLDGCGAERHTGTRGMHHIYHMYAHSAPKITPGMVSGNRACKL